MGERDRMRLRRETVAYIFQSFGLLAVLSAAENVGVPLRIAGVPPKDREERVALMLSIVGLADHARQRPGELSGGQQQRVAIAVAVANTPRVLFADEPTGELDTASGEEVFAALRHANAELGVTVLIVTHDPAVSEQVGRTVRIRDGRTATEVLRPGVGTGGRGAGVAEEYAVLDRVGRLQLPREYTERYGLRRRVRLTAETDHIGVWPDRGAAGNGAGAPGEQPPAGGQDGMGDG
jgi:energy-coupling factor transporter ATP-binding protein EcfA2